MKKTLYLMRHGQTLFNLRKKIQGSCDSPLTELGKKQAEIAGKYFKENGISFDHAYSSTQERAVDTLEIVTDFKMPYTRLKGIKEWDFGVFEGESEDLNPKHAEGETYKEFFKKFGGESFEEVTERVNRTLTEIMDKENHESVLAVSHGGACYTFFLKWEKKIQLNGIANCSIFKYEYEEGRFRFIEIINHNFENLK